jgi:nucleotide-binding universal stress UspA family protein
MSTTDVGAATTGPILFVYDGSALAGLAIERAGRELATNREAIVLCVWQPADVGFEPVNNRHFDADAANEVRSAAEETAEFGASLARSAAFRARGLTAERSPTWKGIIETAEEYRVSLIVIGAHRHTGLVGHLLGSVTAAVVSHAACSVLVVHQESSTNHEHKQSTAI